MSGNHTLIKLVVLLLAAVTTNIAVVDSEVVYISPDPDTVPCPNDKVSCMTLSQYASQPDGNFASDTALQFLPGNHVLDRIFSLSSLSSFTMLRASYSSESTSPILISCVNETYFEFRNFDSVHISALDFVGCNENRADSVNEFLLDNTQFLGTNHSASDDPNQYSGIRRDMLQNEYKNHSLSISDSTVTITSCKFTRNKASVLSVQDSNMTISGSVFNHNTANHDNGTAISSANSKITITSSNFTNNSVYYKNDSDISGGVLYLERSEIHITNCYFANNAGNYGGAVYVYMGNVISISNSDFINNNARNRGGVFYVDSDNNVSITGSEFNNNFAKYGSVFFLDENNSISIDSSKYKENTAMYSGGIFYVYTNNSILITDSSFTDYSTPKGGVLSVIWERNFVYIATSNFTNNNDNLVAIGGVIYVNVNNNIYITDSNFNNNNAKSGAVVYIQSFNKIYITGSTFDNNNAVDEGGIAYIYNKNNVSISNSSFTNNSASIGGLFYAYNSTIDFSGYTNMIHNKGEQGVLYVIQCTVSFDGDTSIGSNIGSVFAFGGEVTFRGETRFFNNSQSETNKTKLQEGGAMTAFKSAIYFTGNNCIIYNTADNGGGISVLESTVYFSGSTAIEQNSAKFSGGGIYAYQSQLYFEDSTSTVGGNIANERGGGIVAIGCTISLSTVSLLITENTADRGGGIHFELNSKLIILKREVELDEVLPDFKRTYLNFTYNVAHRKGGAIYVNDYTSSGICASNGLSGTVEECFLQELSLYSSKESMTKARLTNTHFINNTANEGGESLYGGLLDRCTVSLFAENYDLNFTNATGIDYFQTVTNLTNNRGTDSISSGPVRLCFCENDQLNCSYQHPIISIKKGHTINVPLVAVDQIGHTITGSSTIVRVQASHDSGLKEGQGSQYTNLNGSCTELQYNIFSPHSSEQLVLYPEGPCKYVGISKQIITINFTECDCPVGFKPKPSAINCSCICDPILQPMYVKECFSNQTLLRAGNSWIGSINSSGYIIAQHCPYDYCHPANQLVYINLSLPNGSDAQCAFDRSGKLCGSCADGLSLSLGSSQCLSCTNNYWLALLLPFSIAGIALVIFILICNFTVASGTINGLIFYANIISANHATFLSHDKTKILTIFIAWLNLDLGIKTCFYDGMDAYAKVWLQLVFPIYIILLIILIIMICKWSDRFANLIGNKNPVATLATLLLLSYANLLRTIITALSFSVIDHLEEDGSHTTELLWRYDAKVAYFNGKHIPLIVVALLILATSVVYTFLLLFWQWLQRCSDSRAFKWVNNTKLNALMDAYHAPLKSEHRYWVGLLLLVRVGFYLASILNVSGDPSVSLLAVCSVLAGLLGIKVIFTIYENRALDILNMTFLLNLCLLAAFSLYDFENSIFTYICLAVSFVTFLGILVYHSYKVFFHRFAICNTFVTKCWTLHSSVEEYDPILSDILRNPR